MNEDALNMEIRKFLKQVGVTSQREIEKAVRAGLDSGKLGCTENLKALITLTFDGLDLEHTVEQEIVLS